MRSIKTRILFLIVVLTFGMIGYYNFSMSSDKTLKIWSPRVPYSLDPLDYDALAHHICFRSVYASLVSDYKLGEIQGIIAERWEINSDKSEWSFYIRPHLKFSNGDEITSHVVAQSLNRAALVMKFKGSESGVLEFLKGQRDLKESSQLASGIHFDDQKITLQFVKPMPDLLEKIGFGLYAIVSPKDYDSKTGVWLDKNKILASGPYQVSEWQKDRLVLDLRRDFPQDLLLQKPIQKAVYSFSPDKISNSDLVVDFDDSLAMSEEFLFFGPVKSGIRYVACEGWQSPSSACHNKETRKQLRDQFYQSLSQQGFKVTKSFFPLAIQGVHELDLPTLAKQEANLRDQPLVVSKVNPAFKHTAKESSKTAQEAFDGAVANLAQKFGFKVEIFTPPPSAPLSGNVDLRFRMTAILVDAPESDIKFMLLSQHGIMLPDETGEIKKYVKSDRFSIQKVNEMLWEQAIVWPVGHMALGLWKKDNEVSLNSYNLVLPPLDLQWIEWN